MFQYNVEEHKFTRVGVRLTIIFLLESSLLPVLSVVCRCYHSFAATGSHEYHCVHNTYITSYEVTYIRTCIFSFVFLWFPSTTRQQKEDRVCIHVRERYRKYCLLYTRCLYDEVHFNKGGVNGTKGNGRRLYLY